ncbi:MAG: hypothetical protein PHG02_02100 [Oscillospiraceae bacterium]|nr:hypothetical protein [Oscillospiraceae bacterium]
MTLAKKLIKAVALFLPFVLALVGFNLYADPANLFNKQYEQNVAQIMAQGKNATNLKNMDDRLLQQNYAVLAQTPTTLVLGPSRGMQLSRALTGQEQLYNAGVTGADLRDMVSFFKLYESLGKTPQNVIVVIEPWLTGEESLNTRAYTKGYEEFCAEIGQKPLKTQTDFFERYVQLFSFTYFQSSVAFLQSGGAAQRMPDATSDYYTKGDMRRADGSYCYNEAFREASQEKRDEEAQNCIIKTPAVIDSFVTSGKALELQFDAFVAYMQQKGVKVALMIPPINPIYYDYMVQNSRFENILATEQFYTATAEKYGLTVFGSYNPHALGLTTADFYDGLHCTDTALAKFYPQDLFKS